MSKKRKITKTTKSQITPEDRKILSEAYLWWLYECGSKIEKEDIIVDGQNIFLLCGEGTDDCGLDLKYIGYTPEEIEENLIKKNYYKDPKQRHFLDWFNERFNIKTNAV